MIVHAVNSHRLWVKAHACFYCFSIALMKIVESISQAWSTLILHKCIETSWLGRFSSLLARIKHFSSTIEIVHTSLQMLRICYWLILVVSQWWDLLILTIWGTIISLIAQILRDSSLIVQLYWLRCLMLRSMVSLVLRRHLFNLTLVRCWLNCTHCLTEWNWNYLTISYVLE